MEISITEFYNHTAKYLDAVDMGECVFVRRGNKCYAVSSLEAEMLPLPADN